MTKKKANIFSGEKSVFEKMADDVFKIAAARSHKKKVPTTLPATELGETFPKPVGKPATILYKKLPDDMILITGLENFLSIDAIFEKYGMRVTKAYSDYPYHMTGDGDAVALLGMINCPLLTVGQLSSKGGFSKIIAHVKKCGSLLHDIIQACEKGEVKRIEIGGGELCKFFGWFGMKETGLRP